MRLRAGRHLAVESLELGGREVLAGDGLRLLAGGPAAWRIEGAGAVGRLDDPVPHELHVRLTRGHDTLVVATELRAERLVPVVFGWRACLRPSGGREHRPAGAAPLGDRDIDEAFTGLPDDATWACGDIDCATSAACPPRTCTRAVWHVRVR